MPKLSRLVVAEIFQLLLNLICGSLCLAIDIRADSDSYLAMAVGFSAVHNIVSLGTMRRFAVLPCFWHDYAFKDIQPSQRGHLWILEDAEY